MVVAGLASDPTLLANETRTFIDTVNARLSAMDDAGRRAMNNTIRTCFPMADFQLRPGVTTEVFNLDLRVTENNVVTFERYGFQQAGTDWVLINIATKAGR